MRNVNSDMPLLWKHLEEGGACRYQLPKTADMSANNLFALVVLFSNSVDDFLMVILPVSRDRFRLVRRDSISSCPLYRYGNYGNPARVLLGELLKIGVVAQSHEKVLTIPLAEFDYLLMLLSLPQL